MTEPLNSDYAEVTIGWLGNLCGCGWCGAVQRAEDGFPDCCDRMAEWKQRAAAVFAAPEPQPEPEPHDAARWSRVLRRWNAKRGG